MERFLLANNNKLGEEIPVVLRSERGCCLLSSRAFVTKHVPIAKIMCHASMTGSTCFGGSATATAFCATNAQQFPTSTNAFQKGCMPVTLQKMYHYLLQMRHKKEARQQAYQINWPEKKR